jgi:hypothetical protein
MSLIAVISGSGKGVPAAPTIGTATNVGTGRAYNNGAATVTFTAPTYNGRSPITSYTVTSSPGGFTASGASSPLTVTGLQSATAYTFTVTATNASGTSAASSASNSITATTVPQAPTIGTATAGNTSATVTYTANATGGAAVSAYTATSSPGSITGTGSSPITVSGLSNGTAYTFTVTATNANGTSIASSASNSVTPIQPTSFDSIARQQPSSGQSVTFSSIPNTYKYLQVRVSLMGDNNNNSFFMRMNGDAGGSSYSWGSMSVGRSGGSAVSTAGQSPTTDAIALTGLAYRSTVLGYQTVIIIDIMDYAVNTKNKTAKYVSGVNANNTANQELNWGAGTFRSTNAINSLTFFFNGSGVFQTGTSIALYGVN